MGKHTKTKSGTLKTVRVVKDLAYLGKIAGRAQKMLSRGEMKNRSRQYKELNATVMNVITLLPRIRNGRRKSINLKVMLVNVREMKKKKEMS